ncbi:putative dehydrogenase [Dyadobacter jejuensis]|uniref:Putative dehydrogenase n=1 Tax=Dyadobacter jejuensis TaxID=1082580 RepID=A0A316AKM4_9BACT|nr:Gfo/Idh/MocA family oxidoreductase [Dyadobacter jejuensis]PWJ57574.1 putative dehydrogenase [Dyadobacter jejuensis]
MRTINTALLSYGMSGKIFHAPFLQLHPGFNLLGSWERSKKLIQQDYPEAISYPSLASILEDDNIELVIVNTPINSHYEYTKAVLLAGKHAVVEKAFTVTAAEAIELEAIAREKRLKLSVFQNRRWDSDFKTVKKIVDQGVLGDLVEVTFAYEQHLPDLNAKAHLETPSPGAGLLRDRGSHVTDQALSLFGMPDAVFGDLRIVRKDSQVNDYFDMLLYYPDLRVRVKGSFICREMAPAYILHGQLGSFLKHRGDKQEDRLVAGDKPDFDTWCTEPEGLEGTLHTLRNGEVIRESVSTERGNYVEYFEGVYQSIVNGADEPVTGRDGVNTMRVLEAAIKSNEEGRVVPIF